ncbi:MAG: cation:proton antiporter [Candidatus Woesearchaeota archaeon]
MNAVFASLCLIILTVFLVTTIIKLLKQPLIIGYILSGIITGPLFLNILRETTLLNTLSSIGISFLLFIVGLNLSPKVIKEVGKISLITGIGQVIFTSIIGYFIGLMLGFSSLTSLYIAVALTFSSTIIIMKLLSDKDDLDKLYGKISIGFLLVQDLIAMLILLLISSISQLNFENFNLMILLPILWKLLSGLFVGFVLVAISYFVLKKIGEFLADSQEFLFLFAITWCLGISFLFNYIGLTLEIGALISGVLLSIFPYSYEISSKLKPLRDFFIIFFFLILGSQMIFTNISRMIIPTILFSLFILIGNPFIVMVLMGILGYTKKTGFLAGLTVAQISEFSLILINLGVRVGHLPKDVLSFVTLVGIITIAGSTYMILYADKIYSKIGKYLSILEFKKTRKEELKKEYFDFILFGYNRIGFSILNAFLKLKKKFLIVDFNPEIVEKLIREGHPCIYGDASDVDFLQQLNFKNTKIFVSTIPDYEANITILKEVKKTNPRAIIILTARQIKEALNLYNEGADFVILPHFLGGEFTSRLIEKARTSIKQYKAEKEKQLKELNKRIEEKHEHPKIERK